MAQPALTQPPAYQTPPQPHGLTAAEVREREQRGETNAYQPRVSRTYWDIVRDNVLNLFNVVLFSLLFVVIYLQDYATAVFAGFSVVSNTFLGMIQEINAKRKLDSLALLSEHQVHVIRDGTAHEISMREVVKDDVIRIEPGDKIVVDGIIIQSDSLEVDESQLTGESDAVYKEIDNEVMSGSFCIAGTGLMQATRVGRESTLNQLSEIAKEYRNVKTPTQRRIDIVVELSVFIMFIFVPMLLISDLLVTEPALPLLQAVRNSVVFVTSLVPQGLVLVAILSLTLGAIKISRRDDTLIQKVNAVESLANATVLCFDKTGTLTKNELRVQQVISLNGEKETAILQQLTNYLHNLAHLNRTGKSVQDYADDFVQPEAHVIKVEEVPFTSGRKWGAVEFEHQTLVLGAPERVLPQTFTGDSVIERAIELSKQGLRVLAFASTNALPEHDRIDGHTTPIALIVLSDKIREDIQETLQSFRDEAISLKVISGDNLETVRSIAGQAGMDTRVAYTGDELDAMGDEALTAAVQQANVFARIAPETKRRIVKALQAKDEYVAMVGDGVNDVPALKQANLAIVMNDGTQISKDVADIVLLNNAMSTLPRAFREGKEITQTILGTMKLFLARNAYAILFFIFIAFMALPFPITPIQISWVTFGTINMSATLIAFAIIRPQVMLDFRRDVLDYILTAGVIGSVIQTALYVIVFFVADRIPPEFVVPDVLNPQTFRGISQADTDLETVRSTITLFGAFFNTYIVLNIQGVNMYQPRTFLRYWRIVLVMTILLILTIAALYLFPALLEFQPITELWILGLIGFASVLSMWLLTHGLRYRYLLNRFWVLFERDKESAVRQQRREETLADLSETD